LRCPRSCEASEAHASSAQAYSDTILLALVTRLVNEPSRSVKAMVVQVLVMVVVVRFRVCGWVLNTVYTQY